MGILDRMGFRALDKNFNAISIIEGYDSIIWTDLYNDVGDFELHGGNTPALRKVASQAEYIFNTATKGLAEIERPEAIYTEEDGSTLTITGRSMNNVLDRRIIDKNKTIYFETNTGDRRISKIICDLVDAAFEVSSSTKTSRYWSALRIVNATPAWSVTLPYGTIPAQALQFTMGDSLLDSVRDLCAAFGLGFRFEFSPIDKTVSFIVYEGANLSIPGQTMIMFSDLYDNLLTGREMYDKATIKTAMLVVGSATDPITQEPRLPQWVVDADFSGLDRREVYYSSDQQDIVYKTDGTQCTMPSADYIAALKLAGVNALNSPMYGIYSEYEGSLLEVRGYKYGVNFTLGDIVAFLLPHHTQAFTARISGMTFVDDATAGKTLAPTFDYGATSSSTPP